jgi:hypothetical protein
MNENVLFSGGCIGRQQSPVKEIWYADDLLNMDMDGHYRLMQDIVLPDNFQSIGSPENGFRGSFDFCQHAILGQLPAGVGYFIWLDTEYIGSVRGGMFEGIDVQVDGNQFFQCTFTNCTFHCIGEKPSKFDHCTFGGTSTLHIGDNKNARNFAKQMCELNSRVDDPAMEE